MRSSLGRLLMLAGHRVYEAVDGPSGVETVLREKPDIALIDIGLPRLDGYGVVKAIRSRVMQQVRLVALSGYGNRDDVERGSEASFEDYLVKPFDFNALNQLLQTHCAKHGQVSAPARE